MILQWEAPLLSSNNYYSANYQVNIGMSYEHVQQVEQSDESPTSVHSCTTASAVVLSTVPVAPPVTALSALMLLVLLLLLTLVLAALSLILPSSSRFMPSLRVSDSSLASSIALHKYVQFAAVCSR
jgi:hypothetical protein